MLHFAVFNRRQRWKCSLIVAILGFVTTACPMREVTAQVGSVGMPSLWTRMEGEDWPRMLGARYDSTSSEKGIRTNWGDQGLRVVWSAPTGEGYGNGVASHGRWFQFDRFADSERLTCHHAETGRILWTWESPVTYRDAYGYNNGPRCSPVVDEERVYVYGAAGNLACLSTSDGKLIWEKNLNEEFWVIPNFFGVGASPLVYRDMLWVMVGGSRPDGRSAEDLSVNDVPSARPNQCAMVGFDKRTGKVLHRVGNYLASYAAPVVREIDGKDVLLALVREGLLALDPSDGSNERFFAWRASSLESVNGAPPSLVQGNVLIGEAYEKGGALLQVGASKIQSLWTDGKSRRDQVFRPHWTNPLVIGSNVFVSSGRNEPDTDLRCLEWSTEQTKIDVNTTWSIRNRDRMTGIVIDNHLLLLGESGILQLVKPNKSRFELVAEMDLATRQIAGEQRPYVLTPSWAPPVVSHGLLYVRGTDRIVCLELIPEN
ncbi:PQQ-binding-like beta-propeller repeat protein [Pirellulaceae bacterium SH467]